jgi:hypothetical protein
MFDADDHEHVIVDDRNCMDNECMQYAIVLALALALALALRAVAR